LINALRAGGRRRLVLIHAPSGFGKSTLAAQWRDELCRDGVAVGWLTVDDDDNNVVWFLAHVLESIRRERPALAASLCQVLEEHGHPLLGEAAQGALRNMNPIERLVIDD
jgi:serine/threonine-protein kinase PknK